MSLETSLDAQRAMQKPSKYEVTPVFADLQGWKVSVHDYLKVCRVANTDKYVVAKSYLSDSVKAVIQSWEESSPGTIFTFEGLYEQLVRTYFPVDVRVEVIGRLRSCKQFQREPTDKYLARFQAIVNQYPPCEEKDAKCSENLYFGIHSSIRVLIDTRTLAAERNLTYSEMLSAARQFGSAHLQNESRAYHAPRGSNGFNSQRRDSAMSGVEYNQAQAGGASRRAKVCYGCGGIKSHKPWCKNTKFDLSCNAHLSLHDVEEMDSAAQQTTAGGKGVGTTQSD